MGSPTSQPDAGRRARTSPVSHREPASNLTRRVYEQLRGSIVALKLSPGVPVSEMDLCRRLGASRTPVHEAICRLQRDGLLTMMRVGAKPRLVVAPLTADDMRQLFLMVGALDGVAARLAARLEAPARLALVERLECFNGELRQFSQDPEASGSLRVEQSDRSFHRAYEAAASAPQLSAELEALHARRERYVRVYTEALVHAHNLRESIAEHDAIVAALRAGDADAAEQCAAFNHRNALQRFTRALEANGERGSWF